MLSQQENVCPLGNTPRVPASLHLKCLGICGQAQIHALNVHTPRIESATVTIITRALALFISCFISSKTPLGEVRPAAISFTCAVLTQS